MRDILVLSERYDPFDGAVPYAAAWARRLDGMLSGLHVVEPIMPSVPPEAMAVGIAMMAEVHERAERARRAAAGFAGVLERAHVARGEWHVALGPRSSAVAQFARWHDLLVFDGPQDGDSGSIATAGSVLLASGLPCLVVPPRHVPVDDIERIVIAWNGSPESTRALRAARPLLGLAKRLVVLVGAPRQEPWVAMPDAFGLDRWFEREGLVVEHYPLEVPDDRSGGEILAVATDMEADLLVMGAYGRSRFNEWLLGGATRHVLAESRIPALMMH